jgi:hypothetical protein
MYGVHPTPTTPMLVSKVPSDLSRITDLKRRITREYPDVLQIVQSLSQQTVEKILKYHRILSTQKL